MEVCVFSWKNLTDELLEDLLYDLIVMNLVRGRCSKAYSFPSWYYCVTVFSSWYKSEFLLYGGLQQRKKEKKKRRVAFLGHITCLGKKRVRIILMAYFRREVAGGGHRSIPNSAISINFPRAIV